MSEMQSCFKRVEKKYILTPDQYDAMRRGMYAYTKPDAYSHYTINNIYYDTDSYLLVRTSLEKPVYKEKFRVRSYGVPNGRDDVFVELKKKFRDTVYKRRITMNVREMADSLKRGRLDRTDQISREINWFLRFYHPEPAAFIGYDREAFAGTDNPELRITFDTSLRGRSTDLDLRCRDSGTLILPPDRVLMEVKIPDSAPLWLARLLSENGIFPSSFSKYGTYYTHILGVSPAYGTFKREEKNYA